MAFYAGVPLLFSLYAAANNWQLIDRLGVPGAFLYYAAHAVVPWLVTAGITTLTMGALRAWRPSPWIIMLIGSIIACLVTIPYVRWVSNELPWFGVVRVDATMAEPWRNVAYLTRATLVWLAVNYVFDRFLGYPRYRYTVVVDRPGVPARTRGRPDATARPVFMQRMRLAASLDDLMAIKAEQHYIQVITTEGAELVLYRLGDAVREMPLDYGIRVHRSWWVSRRAVKAVHSQGKKVNVVLTSGLEVPVSAPYQALAKMLSAEVN